MELISRESLIETAKNHYSEDSITGKTVIAMIEEFADKTPTIPSIPLETVEKMKQEIEEINPVEYGDTYDYEIHKGVKYCKEDVLEIVSKYIKE